LGLRAWPRLGVKGWLAVSGLVEVVWPIIPPVGK
jgi:hypothetical protein